MMKFSFYSSLPFWISFVLLAGCSRVFDSKPKLRPYFLFFSSSLMILAIPQFTLLDLFLVFGLSSFSFVIGSILNRKRIVIGTKLRKSITLLGIVGILSFLIFLKYRFVQDLILKNQVTSCGPSKYLFLIGVSYFSFKMLHFVIECSRQKIEGLSLINYLTYIIFFPPFISGPINRYNHFSTQINIRPPTTIMTDLKRGGERIIHGLFKKFVLVQILYPHVLGNQARPLDQLAIYEVVFGLYAYAFYFYFDFSGYSDLAIGSARVMGVELPENFNNPFLKRNIRELWTNWHMSLTAWLVDYIYWPLVRKMRNLGFFRDHPVLLSNVGMILTFVVCGMWHGEAFNFILWGAYHGIGISMANTYQREKKRIRNPFVQKYFRSKYSAVAGTFLTFNFFSFGLALFVLDLEKLRVVVSHVLF